MIPRNLSHYRVLEKIGSGGMGVVYRAHDETLDRDVALKVLPTGTLSDEQARRRFRREALSLARLNRRLRKQGVGHSLTPTQLATLVAVERHVRNFSTYEVDYNIEIKSTAEGDNKFHPTPDEYSELVFNLVDQYLPLERLVIQSFDFRVLKYWHQHHPEVRLAVRCFESRDRT